MPVSCSIPRTAAFAWSPSIRSNYIATGTKAGAVDEGFSNETRLELWEVGSKQDTTYLKPLAKINTDSRFNDLAWTKQSGSDTDGIVAGALENGSLDLWDAAKLLTESDDALVSRTNSHSGAIKALQFNPFRSELLATAGAKGELFVTDINNIGSPFRVGNAVARADEFDCLDWNKRTSHIMVTGSSGGTMTVWDVKNKRESLTLNNLGRKPVSAVAWDPIKTTRVATAIPLDTEPVILIWDLRNAHAPEKILKGHDGGILSLSWCQQDSDLLLSCGKDNRTIFWNPQSGETLGEFGIVTNWTFQTRWNPHNPSLVATASYDGNVLIHPIQNLNASANTSSAGNALAGDDEDFFTKQHSQPMRDSFSLNLVPKWLNRSCSARFGFGGKLICLRSQGNDSKARSSVHISDVPLDDAIRRSTENFEASLKQGSLADICSSRILDASSQAEKCDWQIIKTLLSEDTRKGVLGYLGFTETITSTIDSSSPNASGDVTPGPETTNSKDSNSRDVAKRNRLSAFFDEAGDSDTFLSELAASKTAKTNNPFDLCSGADTESGKSVTQALLLGQFEKALDICLKEDLMVDAFLIATCGGESCIRKAQNAYFKQNHSRPSRARLLASIVGGNHWDLVHNANLHNWKEIMATLCTYADPEDFPDLCEALGDRMEESLQDNSFEGVISTQDITLCYAIGGKLEKLTSIWLSSFKDREIAEVGDVGEVSGFSIHARSLQAFVEKITVFRAATQFEDDQRDAKSDWRLSALYDKYIEYADIASAHGQLEVAKRYLELLPNDYGAGAIAKSRVAAASGTNEATKPKQKTEVSRGSVPGLTPAANDVQRSSNKNAATAGNSYQPAAAHDSSPYAPKSQDYTIAANLGPHAPSRTLPYAPQTSAIPPPLTASSTASTAPTSMQSKSANVGNWNDTPESFFKPLGISRRGTPVASTGLVNPHVSPNLSYQAFSGPPKAAPLAPPPKPSAGGSATLPLDGQRQGLQRPPSVTNPYTPSQSMPSRTPSTNMTGSSNYNVSPAPPASNNRYAPIVNTPSGPESNMNTVPGPRQHIVPPMNPYAPQKSSFSSPATEATKPVAVLPPPPSAATMPQRQDARRDPAKTAAPAAAAADTKVATQRTRHPPGDRSHIAEAAKPIFEILSTAMQRVRSRAPPSFLPQVNDTEKRLNLLFDHLNNEELLLPDTIAEMNNLAQALQNRDFEKAQAIHVEILAKKGDQCGNWMVGVKRLIAMSKAAP